MRIDLFIALRFLRARRQPDAPSDKNGSGFWAEISALVRQLEGWYFRRSLPTKIVLASVMLAIAILDFNGWVVRKIWEFAVEPVWRWVGRRALR